ncbi:unnamed protein product [Parajaminaea phylloscopi]
MWWRGSSAQGDGGFTQTPSLNASSGTAESGESDVAANSSERRRAPPRLLGLATSVFFVAFTGAAIYGFRAAKRAELREAAELAKSNVAPQQPPSTLTRSHHAANTSRTRSNTTAPGLDWGSSGTAAPSVLSKSAAAAGAPKPGSSQSSRFSVPLPKMQDGKPVFDEPPALTAIKAFGLATVLVGAFSVASIEIGRRVWQIEDVYDLTDRLHANAPKTFAFAESIGFHFRPRLEGLFPQTEEDRADPWVGGEGGSSSASQAAVQRGQEGSGSVSILSRLNPFGSSSAGVAAPVSHTRTAEEAFQDMEQAETMRERLRILDSQLRAEKAEEDAFRRDLRIKREHRAANC